MEPHPAGERFGNYSVTSFIGKGGMGAVYRAVHPEIGKVVAIKVLRPEFARDDMAVARFFDEARAVNAIRHEGIVDIFDLGRRQDGTVYLVMEYLTGEDLARLLTRRRRLPLPDAIDCMIKVCESVGAAHRRGVIHRDLKPQNIFAIQRGQDLRVKVLDFGIAKLLHRANESRRPDTNSGVILGTVEYMAPEQASARPVDERADIYSLGCILYELCTGQPPFVAPNPLTVLTMHMTSQPERMALRAKDAEIPAALDEIMMRALAKDPGDRFSSTEELSAALRAVLPDLDASEPVIRTEEVAKAMAPTVERAALPELYKESAAPPQAAESAIPSSPEIESRTPVPATSSKPAAARASDGTEREAAARGAALPRGRAETPDSRRDLTPTRTTTTTADINSSLVSKLSLRSEQPLIDAQSERRVVRILIPVVISFFIAALVLYFLPRTVVSIDHATLRAWLPVFGIDTVAIVTLMVLVVRTQQRSGARYLVNRAMTLLAVATITVSLHLKGSLSCYDILYYPLLVIIDRCREQRSLARLSLIASCAAYLFLLLLEQTGLAAYAPLYPGRIDPAYYHDRGLLGLCAGVVTGATLISYILIDHLATLVAQREEQLREIGSALAGRVEEQVELLRRSESLRRYVSPQLAESILRGEAASMPGHGRFRISLVRIDCPALAQGAERIDPEEFAHILNQFFADLADLAIAHSGSVIHFGSAEVTVLFGAPKSQGPAIDARAALEFSLEALARIRELSRLCEAAGIEEPPVGRSAVHTGFAAVGNFGSPTRLEYTAVGPLVKAIGHLLVQVTAGTVLCTHATYVLIRDLATAIPRGESPLPGAHHAMRLYEITSVAKPAAR